MRPESPRSRRERGPKGRGVDDTALAEVRALLGTRPRRRDLLIEHLHLIQDEFGCLEARHLRALAGVKGSPPPGVPVRVQFAYRKKPARREYVRVHLRRAEDGVLEAAKFPREGAGLLSSLVDTDGVVELGESVTRVEPGQIVDCFTYASLL